MCIDIHSFDKTVCSFFPLLFLPFWVSENSLSMMIKLFSFQKLLFYIYVSNLHGVYVWTYGVVEMYSAFFSDPWSEFQFVWGHFHMSEAILSVFFVPSSQLGWDSLYLLLLRMYAGELVPPDCRPSFHFQNNLDYFGTFMSCYF